MFSTGFQSNNSLVQSLDGSTEVKDVMKYVNRRNFTKNWSSPLQNRPERILKDLPLNQIGDKTNVYQQTVSAPTMHAKAIEYLKGSLRPGSKVLDVGSGSGYLTACFAKMVFVENEYDSEKQGKVVGIDVHKELIDYSQKIIDETYPLFKNIIEFQQISAYDYFRDGLEEYFDAINVGATSIGLPESLVKLLKKGGQMVIPLQKDDGRQIFTLVEKDLNGEITEKDLMGVVYVPLVK